jgi:hypothetical protein
MKSGQNGSNRNLSTSNKLNKSKGLEIDRWQVVEETRRLDSFTNPVKTEMKKQPWHTSIVLIKDKQSFPKDHQYESRWFAEPQKEKKGDLLGFSFKSLAINLENKISFN